MKEKGDLGEETGLEDKTDLGENAGLKDKVRVL